MDFGAPGALALACRLLAAGEALVLPTETLYGFSALANAAAARGRIEAWKGIAARRGFLALVPSLDAVWPFLAETQDRRAVHFLRAVWPAPLTAVLRVREALPWGEALESGATAAFRVPAHARLRALLEKVGAPVVSTSVNRTGEPALRRQADIARGFAGVADLWCFRDRGLEMRQAGPGSTIADCTGWPPRLLRPGLFDLEASLRVAPVS
jgi:L-threonylcarbamoyladenylate synthase